MHHKKYPADSREKSEKWQFEYEQDSPLNKTERDVIDPQKLLDPQNLNGSLRENVQFVGIPKDDYTMQRQKNIPKSWSPTVLTYT